jgi:hypothetical protein
MSLAAAVLLSLGLGYGLGWWWQGDPVTGPALAGSASQPSAFQGKPNEQIAVSPPTSKDKIRTLPFVLPDPTSDELRQIDLPVVNASDLGPNWEQQLNSSNVPDEFLQDLRANGVNVRQTRTMTRIRLPDGRLVLVPIDYFFEQPFQ